MARCYYLDYISNSFFGNKNDKYICKLCGRQWDVDDPQVKYCDVFLAAFLRVKSNRLCSAEQIAPL